MEKFYRVESSKKKGKLFKKLKWCKGYDRSSDLVLYKLVEVARIPVAECTRNFVKRKEQVDGER